MSDFFGRLELELRAAAERPPRRAVGFGTAARGAGLVLAVTVALAVVLVPALLLLGGGDRRGGNMPAPVQQPRPEDALPPVGTVIPKGEGGVPRDSRSTVVATGTAPVVGSWQLDVSESTRLADPQTGEEFQPAGLPCLSVLLADPPEGVPVGRSARAASSRARPASAGSSTPSATARDGSGRSWSTAARRSRRGGSSSPRMTASAGVSSRSRARERVGELLPDRGVA
jgi:hypothetical protein